MLINNNFIKGTVCQYALFMLCCSEAIQWLLQLILLALMFN